MFVSIFGGDTRFRSSSKVLRYGKCCGLQFGLSFSVNSCASKWNLKCVVDDNSNLLAREGNRRRVPQAYQKLRRDSYSLMRMHEDESMNCTSQSDLAQSESRIECSWTDVESLVKDLAKQVENANVKFDTIMGITRGGMIPAILLSQHFQLRNVVTASVLFYTDEGDRFYGVTEPRFLHFPEDDLVEGARVLVVDDVWDSGRTARAVRARVKRAGGIPIVCTLHFKPQKNAFSGDAPDFFAEIVEDWVVYPWERLSPANKVKEERR